MILATVGTQLPFDRMISALDRWAADHPEVRCIAQIGPTSYRAKALSASPFMLPDEMETHMKAAELVVAHAGMGTILSAMRHRKPIVIMPRSAAAGEHRNEHQAATARWLAGRPGIHIAWNESELVELVDRRSTLHCGESIAEMAQGSLVARLRAFIHE